MNRADAAMRALAQHRHRRLGDIAVQRGWITAAQLDEALQSRPGSSEQLGGMLVSRGWISAAQLMELVQEERRIDAGLAMPTVPPEAAPALLLPERSVDQYVLVTELGRGGSGAVWKAWDRELNRWVAVKLLRLETPEGVDRMSKEAQLAARLNHPGIVAVHGIGRRQGTPYIVMQLVDGTAATRALPIRRGLEVVRDAAHAVHFAHQHGVMHRDLKPGNLLIDRENRVFVADFGLARLIDGGDGRTLPGSVMGTPAYMPPEQARGGTVTPASDIYSLGAVLYEFCTGSPPYSHESAAGILADVVSKEPPRPREVSPRLQRDIEAIVMKAMAREPGERYPTAADLALDIERYLSGESILARRYSMSDRFKAWMKRNSKMAAVGIVIVIAAAGMLALHFKNVGLVESADLRRRAADALQPARRALDRWEMSNRRNDDRAIAESIAAAFRQLPGYGPAWLEEGRRFWMMGDHPAAHEAFTKGLDDPETGHQSRLYRARITYLDLHEGMPLPPRSAEVYEAPAMTADQRRRERAVIEDLESFARAVQAGRADPRYEYAMALLDLCQARTPDQYLRAANRMQPGIDALQIPRWEGSYYQGIGFQFGRQYERARAVLEGATHPLSLLIRGFACHSLAELAVDPVPDLEAAIASYSTALERNPRFTAALDGRGQARVSLARRRIALGGNPLEDLKGAIIDYGRILEEDPMHMSAWVNRGIAHSCLAEYAPSDEAYQRAIVDFDKAIEIDGSHAITWNQRGIARREQADWRRGRGIDASELLAKAIEDHSKAIRLKDSIASWQGRGNTRWSLASQKIALKQDARGDLAGAIGDFTEAIERDREQAAPWLSRGRVRNMAGDVAEAERDMSKAIELKPSWDVAHAQRGRLRFAQGRWAEAKADMEKAVALNPAQARKLEAMIKECGEKSP